MSERMSSEAALIDLAVLILCRDEGCVEGEPCPFEPACAADLTAESIHDLIHKRICAERIAYDKLVARHALLLEVATAVTEGGTSQMLSGRNVLRAIIESEKEES